MSLDGKGYGSIGGAKAIVDSVTTTEDSSGTKNLVFTVTAINGFLRDVNNPNDGSFTANYTTVDGTAITGIDYEVTSGTLNFAPGERSKTITVKIKGDTEVEKDESFSIKVYSSVLDASTVDSDIINDSVSAVSIGTATITNDDQQASE